MSWLFMSRTTWFSIFSGSSERLMRSLRLILMSCARRLKIPMRSLSLPFGARQASLRQLGERRQLLRERHVDLVERGLELVEVEVLELERAREDDRAPRRGRSSRGRAACAFSSRSFRKRAASSAFARPRCARGRRRAAGPRGAATGGICSARLNEKGPALAPRRPEAAGSAHQVGLDVLSGPHRPARTSWDGERHRESSTRPRRAALRRAIRVLD